MPLTDREALTSHGFSLLAGLAIANCVAAARATRRHRATGAFVEIRQARLHYRDEGVGAPVLFLHGNAVTMEDWRVSGLFGAVARTHRAIALDRPGFGHSTRPKDCVWDAFGQAELLGDFLTGLGVERAIIVAHAFGTQPALALAARRPDLVAGLVLLSGVYFPEARLDPMQASTALAPVLGDIFRHTIGAAEVRAGRRSMVEDMFAPAESPKSFPPIMLGARQGQYRAALEDHTSMAASAEKLAPLYAGLRMPIVAAAGAEDRIADCAKQAVRLTRAIPQAQLVTIEGSGHMIHHTHMWRIESVIDHVVEAAQLGPALLPPIPSQEAFLPEPLMGEP